MQYRIVALLAVFDLASCQSALKQEPKAGTLSAGEKVLVDDGTCPVAQVKPVTSVAKLTSQCNSSRNYTRCLLMIDPLSFEDDIYQAAFVFELWPKVLDRISRAIGAEGALLANLNDANLPWIASEGVQDLISAFFEEGWAYDNARTHALLTIPHRGFMSDADHLDQEWMAEQAIYRDFLWPRGFGYAAGTTIESPGAVVIGISIEKKRELGPVSGADLEFLDQLRPHLSRSALLANRLEFAKVDAAVQALKMADVAAATIRADGRLLSANSLLEQFAHSVRVGAHDLLHFSNAAADTFYRRMTETGSKRKGQSFPIPATEFSPPAILHFVPISGVAREIFLQAAYFLLITSTRNKEPPPAELIKGLFDLTATESRIAEKLVRGHVIAEIAQQERSGVETVRSHVKAILHKAGMSTQRDFIAAMSRFHPIHP
jgi:DNA-binding CsgD family transcriptional regulator